MVVPCDEPHNVSNKVVQNILIPSFGRQVKILTGLNIQKYMVKVYSKIRSTSEKHNSRLTLLLQNNTVDNCGGEKSLLC